MLTKEQLVELLCRKRFPKADAVYKHYKETGALDLPQPLSSRSGNSPPYSSAQLERRREHYKEIQEFEKWLLSRTYEELRDEELKENLIEALCGLTISGYEKANPDRIRAISAMSVPTPNSSRFHITISEDPEEVLKKASALKADLRQKSLADVKNLFDEAQTRQWRTGKLSLDEAAALIALKIYPDDGYEWTAEDRKECGAAYRAHLKASSLSGRLPFYNPHTKKQFDPERLSNERFPQDGLFAMESLYLGLMEKHQGKGYLPLPAKQVSRAPAPIKPLEDSPPDLMPHYTLKKPDWNNKWDRLDVTRLWKAACLVADIEPPNDETGKDLFDERQLKGLPVEFHRVWEAVNGDLFFSRMEYVGTAGRMLYHTEIAQFGMWAINKGFSVPDPLRRKVEKFQSEQDRAAKVHPNQASTGSPDSGGKEKASMTHRMETRRDILDPAIDKAIQRAGSLDTAAVYLALRELALTEEPPFTGHLEGDGLCYTNTQGEPGKITKEALRKRLKRRADGGQ